MMSPEASVAVPDEAGRLAEGHASHGIIHPRFARSRALLLALLAQNLATGFTLGALGPLLPSLQQRYEVALSQVTLVMSFVMLAMGLSAPIAGYLLARWSIRRVMLLGCAGLAAGNLIAAVTSSFPIFLAAYALLIGPGVGLLGLVPSTTLVSQWFTQSRGRALGLVTAPIGILIVPPLVAALNTAGRVSFVYLVMTGVIALGGVLLLGVPGAPRTAEAPSAQPPLWSILRQAKDPAFLLQCLGLGLIISPGTIALTHLVNMASGIAIKAELAAMMLSVFGGSGLLGALAFGWLSDRTNPASTLSVNAILQALMWACLSSVPALWSLSLGAFVLGACGGGAMGIFGAYLIQRYGITRFAELMGLSSILVIPFTFVAAPLAGLIVDIFGSYRNVGLLCVAMLGLAAFIFGISIRQRISLREEDVAGAHETVKLRAD